MKLTDKIELMQGDCLIESDKIKSGSVDLILSDLPYGNMNTDGGRKMGINGWDFAIEPSKVFKIADRILRKNGKMIFFSQEPYTSKMITNSIPNIPFCYRAIWEKDTFANALSSNKAMVLFFEDILIFSKNNDKYDFQGFHPLRQYQYKIYNYINKSVNEISKITKSTYNSHYWTKGVQFSAITKKDYELFIKHFGIDKMDDFKTYNYLKKIDNEYTNNLKKEINDKYPATFNLWKGKKYKSNILKYKKDYNGYHPTQKPVNLLCDLIYTFSNENDLVVDLTMGSGSTGVACVETKRKFTGIELDKNYFAIAKARINKHTKQQKLL